jgi:two-component system, LytTR family, sensor kinase
MKNSFVLLSRLLDDKYRLAQHVLFTGLIFFFWFLFRLTKLNTLEDVVLLSLYSATYVVIAYVNIYFLFSRFLLKGKLLTYLILSGITFVSGYLTQSFIYFDGWEAWQKKFTFAVPLVADMLINAITYYMFIGIGLSVKLIKLWIKSEQRISSLEQENLKANLHNLKSQVSPHFLFNTFNNLYVLTRTNPVVASDMLLGFADLLRYQLNECEKDKVRIEMEINYIENFLTLEKLRKNKLDLKINFDRKAVTGFRIEPLLFVCLIENAVKHGSQQMDEGFIHVNMKRNEDQFSFEVVNSKPVISNLGRERSLGKGIDNLKKRLLLSYPEKHSLSLVDEDTQYTARLQLFLS